MTLALATSAFAAEYEFADRYSSPEQRGQWQEQVAGESAVTASFVWHPLGHLIGMAAAIQDDPAAWLDAHREMIGIPADASIKFENKQPLYLAGDDPIEQAELESGLIHTYSVRLADIALIGRVRVITQERGGVLHVTGLTSGVMPEVEGRRTDQALGEGDAWSAAEQATGKVLAADEAELVYVSPEWILARTPSVNRLFWRLVGHDDQARIALLIDANSGVIGFQYEPERIAFAPRHERHFPYDYVTVSAPTVYDAIPPNAPAQCTQATSSPPCTDPAYTRASRHATWSPKPWTSGTPGVRFATSRRLLGR
ncbi:MAG: hypothetical protein IT380_28730 [Myxococcales bacterium]|nr:hypothetical protein [Myxococcales bacterium]